MNIATKFVKITSEELLNGSGIILKFEVPSNEVCIIRTGNELILFPIVKELVQT